MSDSIVNSETDKIMTELKWNKITKKHPNGVGEVAASVWLNIIAKKGINSAIGMQAEECDSLQDKLENSDFMCLKNWLPFLGQSTTFKAQESESIKNELEIYHVLHKMKNKDFRFLSTTNRGDERHSLAVYKHKGNYISFDPNYAVYNCEDITKEKSKLAYQIWINLNTNSDISVHFGTI